MQKILTTDFGESSFSDSDVSFDSQERRHRKKQYPHPTSPLSSNDSDELKDQMPSILISPQPTSPGPQTVNSYASIPDPKDPKINSPQKDSKNENSPQKPQNDSPTEPVVKRKRGGQIIKISGENDIQIERVMRR
jgi:CRP-like cAMP-binding protein